MSFVNERAYIEARLNSNWSTTPIDWENVDFDTPNNSPWIRLSVLNGESDRRNINSGKRHLGLIVIQIFVPVNTGTNTIRGYADSLAAVFDGQDFEDVECGIASIASIGASNAWYQVNVSIPYRRNES